MAIGACGWRREHAASSAAHWPTSVTWCMAPPIAQPVNEIQSSKVRIWQANATPPGGLHSPAMRAAIWPMFLALGLGLGLAVACDRGHPRDEAPVKPPPVPGPATPSCTLAPL